MRKQINQVYLSDVGCIIEIEIMTTIKDVFDWLEQYIENLNYSWFDSTDESFEIIYKDGKTEYIDSFYDGHKISKINIKSMLYNNPVDYIVYGDYEVNEYGVAHAI